VRFGSSARWFGRATLHFVVAFFAVSVASSVGMAL
jgi:hypothetical protein